MSALWESPFFGVTLTILAYWAGCKIQKRTGLVICNGLVLAVMMIIAVLAVFDIPYAAYNAGGSLINLFLGPATVCLAVTIYAQIDLLKKNLLPILAGCAAGGGDFGPQHLGPVPPVRPGPDTDRLPPAQVRHHTHRHRHCGGAGRHCLHHRGGGDLHRHPGQPVRPRAGTPLPGEGSGGGRAGHRRLQPRHGHRPRPGAWGRRRGP